MIPYLQSTPFTTAASSLLAILHYFKPEIGLTKENEFHIWHNTVTLPMRGSSIYALAHYAKKLGLDPTVVVEKKEYSFPDYRFYRYTKEDVENASFSENRHLKKAEKNNILVEEKEITMKTIKNELIKKNILLLRLNTKPIRNGKRNSSNYVVVNGYDKKYFQIIDPGFSALSIPEETMQEAFKSLETKKHRDHRMIVFKQP